LGLKGEGFQRLKKNCKDEVKIRRRIRTKNRALKKKIMRFWTGFAAMKKERCQMK